MMLQWLPPDRGRETDAHRLQLQGQLRIPTAFPLPKWWAAC